MHIATNSEIIDISLEVKTAELAKIFSKKLKKGDVVFFHGEIGVGKTTFIRHLVNYLQATLPDGAALGSGSGAILAWQVYGPVMCRLQLCMLRFC